MAKSNWYDMREFNEFLKKQGDLVEVDEEVDPKVAGALTGISLYDKGPAVIFNNIKGADFPCCVGNMASMQRLLWALGIERIEDLNEEWCRRTEKLVPPKIVTNAPCQEVVIPQDEIDINKYCNIIWHDKDKAPFSVTLGLSITKDYHTGKQNAGIYRGENFDNPSRSVSWGAPEYTHGRQHLMGWEEANEPMPIAIATGVDPISLLVGATRTPPNVDEFELAGALRREPLEMVKCQTIDIYVPASSEFVFEGWVYPKQLRQEITEWFGEYTGHYGEQRMMPEVVITHVTHRKDACFQGTREQWENTESFYINGTTSQCEAYKTLKSVVPGIIDMRCNKCYEAVVKIKKMFKGHPQQVIDAVWGSTYSRYKHVFVVDEDVDIWDYESLHWALSTRVMADRDVTITSRRAGQWLDPASPLTGKGWQSGMGIDCTMPVEDYEFWKDHIPLTVNDPEQLGEVRKNFAAIVKKITPKK